MEKQFIIFNVGECEDEFKIETPFYTDNSFSDRLLCIEIAENLAKVFKKTYGSPIVYSIGYYKNANHFVIEESNKKKTKNVITIRVDADIADKLKQKKGYTSKLRELIQNEIY